MNLQNNHDYDYLAKIVLVGDSGVGKSTLLLRYCDNIYNDTYISTIGVDFRIKTIEYIKEEIKKIVKLQIWDTAGQERFKTITVNYYRHSHAIAIFFDLTDYDSFRNLNKWHNEIMNYVTGKTIIVVVGTKSDVKNKKQVPREEIDAFCNAHSFEYIETSSKNSMNIDNVFTKIVDQAVPLFLKETSFPKPIIKIGDGEEIKPNRKCC
jgi:Ras-related protein Rab-1A